MIPNSWELIYYSVSPGAIIDLETDYLEVFQFLLSFSTVKYGNNILKLFTIASFLIPSTSPLTIIVHYDAI